MSNLFYEVLPLVRSDTLQNFAEGEIIGHHYGDLTRSRVRCIKINANDWLVGAHPWASIPYCFVGGRRTLSFEAITKEDTDGITRQYVRLAVPPSSDAFTVEVAGYGKVSSVSGKLIENPDEIIEDIARIAGRQFSLPGFREACNRRGLRIAGSMNEANTLRSFVNEILDSCGALWAGNDAVFLADPLSYADRIRYPSSLSQVIEAADVAGQLDLLYAWNQSKGNFGAHLLLEAVGSEYNPPLPGVPVIGNYNAKWLRLPRDAETLAKEILGKRAGRFLKVTATVPGRIAIGSIVDIDSNAFDGPMLVESAAATDVETTLTGTLVLETFANLRVKRFTQEIPPTRLERVDVLILEGDQIEVTIFDLQNRSIPDVYVTLDNSVTYKTDARGLVAFHATKGDHTLSLEGANIESTEPFPFYVP